MFDNQKELFRIFDAIVDNYPLDPKRVGNGYLFYCPVQYDSESGISLQIYPRTKLVFSNLNYDQRLTYDRHSPYYPKWSVEDLFNLFPKDNIERRINLFEREIFELTFSLV